jgi:hypothetical protein
MTTGEIFIELIFILLLIGWISVLIYFIFKKRELSNLKIGFVFTIAYKIISISIINATSTYYYGSYNSTEMVGGFIFNFDWLLIPIITFLSCVLRKIRIVKKKALPHNENKKDLVYSDSSKNNTEKSHDIVTSESKNQNKLFDFWGRLFRNKYVYIGIIIVIIVSSVIFGITLGNKQQPNKLVISAYQPTNTPNIQELNINLEQLPKGFKEIGCEEGINNDFIIDTFFNISPEKAKIIYSKCFSKTEKDNASFISEVILYPLTQGEINNITSTYQSPGLDLYLVQNPKISLLQKYSGFGDFSIGVEMSKVEDDVDIHYQIINVIKEDFFVILIKIGLNNKDVIDFENIILESIKSIGNLY